MQVEHSIRVCTGQHDFSRGLYQQKTHRRPEEAGHSPPVPNRRVREIVLFSNAYVHPSFRLDWIRCVFLCSQQREQRTMVADSSS